MTDRLPFTVGDDSAQAFAVAYSRYAERSLRTVSVIIDSAAEWHHRTPVIARTGILAGRTRTDRRVSDREERQAQRACRQYVCATAPRSLGVIGWIQVLLWLCQHRLLIAHLIRLFRQFLADRPNAFQSVRGISNDE